jgi:hypothetical protein
VIGKGEALSAANRATMPSSDVGLLLQTASRHLRDAKAPLISGRRPDEQTLWNCKLAAISALRGFLTYHEYDHSEDDDLSTLLHHAEAIEPDAWLDSAYRLAGCQRISEQYFDDDPMEVWDDAAAIVRQVFAFVGEGMEQ